MFDESDEEENVSAVQTRKQVPTKPVAKIVASGKVVATGKVVPKVCDNSQNSNFDKVYHFCDLSFSTKIFCLRK